MRLVNLTNHTLDFVDGTSIKPHPEGPISIKWVDKERELGRTGIKLVERHPVISDSELARMSRLLGHDRFGIVSLPVMFAVRGTYMEGRVGAVILKSRDEKVALIDKFAI